MIRPALNIRFIKRVLFLSGLLKEEPGEDYPKNAPQFGLKAENVIVSKQLYLNPELTLNMVAREIGTNRTYLSKFFSNEKGCMFRDYINLLRAEQAKSLLISVKHYAIADIAIMSGFGSVRSMNRAFSKKYGKLPSQMRRDLLREGSVPLLQ